MEALKNLGIDILPPTKMVARPFKIKDIDNSIYYAAEVSEFRDFWLEPVQVVFAINEAELKERLNKVYRCEYFMERTLKNFVAWYESITNKKLSDSDIKKLAHKFVC